jgi:hypothetical protein
MVSSIIIAHTLPFIVWKGGCGPMLPLVRAPLEVGREESTAAFSHLIPHLCINTGRIATIKIFFFLLIIVFLINGFNR